MALPDDTEGLDRCPSENILLREGLERRPSEVALDSTWLAKKPRRQRCDVSTRGFCRRGSQGCKETMKVSVAWPSPA